MSSYIHRFFLRAWVIIFIQVSSCCFGAYAQSLGSNDWRYTVRPQDTVSELSRLYLKPHISWQMLANYNRLPDPNIIHTGTQLRVPLKWLAIKQSNAKLISISGDVRVQSAEGVWQAARQGDSLQTGQQIQIGRNSSAKLQLADDSEVFLQPESLVMMDSLSVYAGGYMVDTQMRLQSGRVEVHANPHGRKSQKFEISTPSAVASVRGTQFVVEAEHARTIEQTLAGQVMLQTSQGSVLVAEGYGTAVIPGSAPLVPQVIKASPTLKTATPRFTDFPISFSWFEQPDAAAWTMQVGRDPQMAQLLLTQKNTIPQLAEFILPDGIYHLRAWSIDAQGIPSKPAVHAFEVAIPRQQQGPALQLPPWYFAAGPVALQLPEIPHGRRYLVQMTRDTEGQEPIWNKVNADAMLYLPVPEDIQQRHFLWIWTYGRE